MCELFLPTQFLKAGREQFCKRNSEILWAERENITYAFQHTVCKTFPKKELDRRSDMDTDRYGPRAQNFRQNLNLYPWQENLCLTLSVSLVFYYMKDIKDRHKNIWTRNGPIGERGK